MGRIARGVMVRVLYALCIAMMTVLCIVMYNGGITASGLWVFSVGIVALIVEFFVMKKMTQGFDWKWFSPCTILFAMNGLALVWFLQLRSLSYSTQGMEICTNYTAAQELKDADFTVAASWLDFCSCGHCNGAAEQIFVIMLLIGRYFLPKGVSFYHPDSDQINLFLKSISRTHFFLVIATNGADALDMISYSRYPTIQGNSSITGILLIMFSVGVAQFCIDTLATKESKNSDNYIIVETDMWSALLMLFTNDLPYMGMRLFLLTKYKVFSSMGVFFFFKNFVLIFVTMHKAAIIWWGKDYSEIEEYVISEPYTPEPTRRRHTESRIETPDDLDEISDTESMYSNAQAVKSRQAKQPPEPLRTEKTEEWGTKEEWFSKEKTTLKSERKNDSSSESDQSSQGRPGDSQFLGSSEWDVEQGQNRSHPLYNTKLKIWNPVVDPQYFTEEYADEQDSMLDMSKIGSRKVVSVPLGNVAIKGRIDFSKATPKPDPRDIESAKEERRSKSNRENTGGDDWADEKDKIRDEKVIEDIDEIFNAVDGEDDKKEKKKKKKKEREKTFDEGDEDGGSDGDEKKHKKKKKKKSSHDDEGDNNEEEDDERKEKHKKKKKKKDRDED